MGIKTHNSKLQVQAVCDKQVSYLHVYSTTLKSVNTLDKPP